jgi:HK97 family phage prohead protease
MDNVEIIKAALAVDGEGTITGTAWPFGAGPDRAGDFIEPGAFSVAVADLPMLFGHDPETPIGLWDEVKETPAGLEVRGQLFLTESKRARAVRGLIHGGLVDGLSVRFTPLKMTMRGRHRVYSSVALKEISIVKSPSHPSARITNAKDASAAIADAINRAALALRRP